MTQELFHQPADRCEKIIKVEQSLSFQSFGEKIFAEIRHNETTMSASSCVESYDRKHRFTGISAS